MGKRVNVSRGWMFAEAAASMSGALAWYELATGQAFSTPNVCWVAAVSLMVGGLLSFARAWGV